MKGDARLSGSDRNTSSAARGRGDASVKKNKRKKEKLDGDQRREGEIEDMQGGGGRDEAKQIRDKKSKRQRASCRKLDKKP